MQTRWLIAVLAGGLGAMCACNPAPRYAKPPVAAPPAFKEGVPADFKEGEGWKIAQPGDDKIRGKWWELYSDPALNALEDEVRVSNQTILAAEANYRSARALVVSARSALFPKVTTSPSYTNSRFSATSQVSSGNFGSTTASTAGGTGTSTGGGVGGASGSLINDFSLPIQATYVVDLWHKLRNTVAVNAYQAQASAADIATALLSSQAELAEDYFEVRALDAERRVLDDSVKNYRATLDLTLSLYRNGIDSDEDVSLAETQLDSATVQATDLGVSRAQYEHAIAVLIGKPPAEFSLPVAEFVPKPPDVPVAVPSELLDAGRTLPQTKD